MAGPLSPEEVKAIFAERGETVVAWAKEWGFNTDTVYRVLDGRLIGRRGKAHEIAVALGLKAPATRELPGRAKK